MLHSYAHAYFYSGGDWGGRDLSLLNGDSLSGSFSNVGSFYIPLGAVILGGTDNLVVNANSIFIDGGLSGMSAPGYDLMFSSQTSLTLNGSLASWKNIYLSATNQITLYGSISVFDGGDVTIKSNSPGTTTPIPAAAWLLGSGLMGLVGIRRRTGNKRERIALKDQDPPLR